MDLFSQPEAPETPHVYTVSELAAGIRGLLEMNFESVWLSGEVSGYKVVQSRHAYFTLKDANAQMRCVMFRGARAGLRFAPVDGDQILVQGRVTVYEARGDYQLIVETMEPVGLGALQKAFEQLKAKLEAEGLFDPVRKRPLPAFPWKIGVVTSPTGAVIRDILHVIQRRHPKVSVLLRPVRVQGEGAAAEIAAAIEEMNGLPDLDLLIVGRGGGSIEDLWAFNEEVVARAIYNSRLPVVSAVGHEVDFTIADFVADVRAPTPSAAAEIAVPVLARTEEDLRDLTRRLASALRRSLQERRQRVRGLVDRRFFREPGRILEAPLQRVDEMTARLGRGLGQGVSLKRQRLTGTVRHLLAASPDRRLAQIKIRWQGAMHLLVRLVSGAMQHQRQRLDGLAKSLNALSPLNVLDRGYSLITDPASGRVIQNSAQVKPGDPLRVRLAKGRLDCTVKDILE
ncbi:MAG: exodeoxyribonuclease VII large subunit [Nitrospinaceae bacterium]